MSSLYMCLTTGCGKWHVKIPMEATAPSSVMKPLCQTCNTIMYNVKLDDKLQLMEEPEPEPVEQLHPFDAALLFDTEVYKDNPMMQDVKRWIVEDLQKPLTDITSIQVRQNPVTWGDEHGLLRSVPGPIMVVTIQFVGGESKTKTIVLSDYQQSVEESS